MLKCIKIIKSPINEKKQLIFIKTCRVISWIYNTCKFNKVLPGEEVCHCVYLKKIKRF